MASPYTPETLMRIQLLRAKIADGSITMEEMVEGVKLMRGERRSAVGTTAVAKAAKAKAMIPNADDLLNELGGL